MAKRLQITSPQCIELLTLATRLTPDEFQARHRWLALLTDPKFDTAQLPPVMGESEESETPPVPQLPEYPAPGVEFDLTLDGDARENQPLAMVSGDGYGGGWKHKGPVVKGTQTRRFKFVEIGYQPNWNSVVGELGKHGKIPEGQWREAVKKTYRTNRLSMGVADASWSDPGDSRNFPMVHVIGGSDFHWTDVEFSESWVWLVEVSK